MPEDTDGKAEITNFLQEEITNFLQENVLSYK